VLRVAPRLNTLHCCYRKFNGVKVTSCELQVTGCELRVTSYELRVASYAPVKFAALLFCEKFNRVKVTSYELRVKSIGQKIKLRVASYGLRDRAKRMAHRVKVSGKTRAK
jgi:hypothetical protein